MSTPRPNPRDLLLAESLEDQQIREILSAYKFRDPRKADASFQAIADEPRARLLLAEMVEELLDSLGASADPDLALIGFERLCQAAVHKLQLLSFLRERPRTLELLAKVFGASPFMGDILIRNPVYLYWVAEPRVVGNGRSRRDLQRDISRELRSLSSESRQLDVLRSFKRKELLHIGVRDLLRLASVEETLSSLSLLAELLIQKALEISRAALDRELGLEREVSRGRLRDEFAVLGMGKLGGGELNFSSDVDLVYVYATDRGKVPAPRAGRGVLSKSAYFTQLAKRLTAALSEITNEGQVYRVDLRLRPEGRMGAIAQSLPSFRVYAESRGQTWERLAYLKAWPVAGNRDLGLRLRERMRPFIFSRPLDSAAQEDLRRMKAQVDRKVSARGQQHENVKLGFGGIREIELCVQCLQVGHGHRRRALRERNTLRAISAVVGAGLLSREDAAALTRAYVFLRDVENKLQMVSDAQTHSLPTTPDEFRRLALRLGYRDGPRAADEHFREDYKSHTERVNGILQGILYAPTPARLGRSSPQPAS